MSRLPGRIHLGNSPRNENEVELVIHQYSDEEEGSTEPPVLCEVCHIGLDKAELLLLNAKIKEALRNKRWPGDVEDKFSQPNLIRAVVDALNECAAKAVTDGRPSDGWTSAICNALFGRLDSEEDGVECAFGSRDRLGQIKAEAQREWLVDFCALRVDRKSRQIEGYATQMLVAGEIEWHNNLGKDFEKLLVLDALVCFFVFPKHVGRAEHNLQYYREIAKRRRLSASGMPPAFVLAEYDGMSGFDIHVLGPPEAGALN